MVKVRDRGFTLLSGEEPSAGQFRLNIIFVHGLRGHPRRTWTGTLEDRDTQLNEAGRSSSRSLFSRFRKDKARTSDIDQASSQEPTEIFWPEEYLVGDVPMARIWTYGYDANLTEGMFQANSQNGILHHSQDLAVKLGREIENQDPIVFVAHSLGGIVVKDALRRPSTWRERTRSIVFLGTPHRGSGAASWGQIASKLARLALQSPNQNLLNELNVNSQLLNIIHEEFKTVITDRRIRVHSFQETRGIYGVAGLDGKVVDEFSSKLDLHTDIEAVESIDADHRQMVRCSSKDDERYRAILGVLRQMAQQQAQAHSLGANAAVPANDTSPGTLFVMPFARDQAFVGRKETMTKLDARLNFLGPDRHHRLGLVGLGGIGKSQVAIEYAYRIRDRAPQMSIFWIHASNANRFKQDYQHLAERASLPGRKDPNTDVLQLVCRWLSNDTDRQWLMILDNVDSDETFFSTDHSQPLAEYLPQSSNGFILVTSRNSHAATNLTGGFGDVIEVEAMPESEALDLLRTKVPLTSQEDDATELVKTLESIPLAIIQAAAFIKRMGSSINISKYLQRFRESEQNQASLLNRMDQRDLRRDHQSRKSVLGTWQVTFDQIRDHTPAAADLLALMSMFDRQGIPESLLQGSEDELDLERELAFQDALAPLREFSLVREQAEGRSFEMHRLVQVSTRRWLAIHGEQQKWLSAALSSMARVLPAGSSDTWPESRALLPHARMILAQPLREADSWNHVTISWRTATYLEGQGELTTAEMIFRSALQAGEHVLGMEDHAMLNCSWGLAWLLMSQGKLQEVKSVSRRAVEGLGNLHDASHPDTSTNVQTLSSSEGSQAFDEFESLGRRILIGRQVAFGFEHPATLNSITKMAQLLSHSGKDKAAESYARQALEGFEKVLGPRHPERLISLNLLARILTDRGQCTKAEPMFREALEGMESARGMEHPDTVRIVSGLAWLLSKRDEHKQAESLARWALKTYEQLFGAKHPYTLSFTDNLAMILKIGKRFDESEQLCRWVLKERRKLFEASHSQVLSSVDHLASVLIAKGEAIEEAEALSRQAFERYENTFGAEHPDTLTSLSRLASVLRKRQGSDQEAEEFAERVLKGYLRVYGAQHPHTLTSMNNLACAWRVSGRNAEAIQLMAQCQERCSQALGPEHSLSKTTARALARWQKNPDGPNSRGYDTSQWAMERLDRISMDQNHRI